MIVKKYFSTFLAGTLLATGFVSVAQAGKSDDTLNVAIDTELESIDNYYNTAREGIVISRMVWDGIMQTKMIIVVNKQLTFPSRKWCHTKISRPNPATTTVIQVTNPT